MISHQGGKTRDCGAYCAICNGRSVRFYGATCFVCRERDKNRRSSSAILAILLASSLLVIGFLSAYGIWIELNISK